MEVYVALFDYEKEREDVLSFKKGDKFRIASKSDKKWWAAYTLETRDYGYVPSKYLEAFVDPTEGEEAQKQLETPEGATKRVAMAELMRKIPRTPAAASTQEEEEGEEGGESAKKNGRGGAMIIKPLTDLVHIPDDCVQIEGKKLANPHLESKQHKQLNREIKFTNARGGAQNLGKPELEKVMQRRRPDADGNIGSIKPSSSSKNRASSPGGELGEQLARRTQLLEQCEKKAEEEDNKPEFLKVALRKAQQC